VQSDSFDVIKPLSKYTAEY